MLKEEIQQHAKKLFNEVIAWRRHLHAHPELSYQEFETSAFIKSVLDGWGVCWQPVAHTGVLAVIKGELVSDKVVALRADMDALPITERNAVSYASLNNGVMHACGHDVHTSSLLGVVKILHSLRHRFGGTVKFIFQPGEERLPGGATLMIKDGALQDPVPGSVIGQHVMPTIECGKVAFRKGKLMASMDELRVKVMGKGGHGAQPQDNIDPVVIASHIIVALQQVVSRLANPFTPTVISFGRFIADGAINVIPDMVEIEGTFRTFDETWREKAHYEMKKMAEGTAESMGGKCEFTINRGYPYLFNNEPLTGELAGYAVEYLGVENVVEADQWMASEDFAYYSHAADSCFYLLGIRNEAQHITSSLHTATFNVDENALLLSTGLMAYITLRRLGAKQQ
ncbi:MAG: amidohydrolase [Chitinophagaceae bacterium]|nr:amidohydrolase [Chitinophagaceae bacterium]